ncbi:MAG TPA: hypothetical protein VN203_20880 [Candidatus Acidoferrum sp.]|nr:hypothetical protein [Candidatus Acidoferrum sp.]
MTSCGEIAKRIDELSAVSVAETPATIQEHVTGCPACARALAVARLSRGLLRTAAETCEPPHDFADQVLQALPARQLSRPETEMWHLGWRLVPAFAATVALLLILFQSQPRAVVGNSVGLLPMVGLSTGEQLVLESNPPEADAVLTAVMEEGRT